MISILLNLLLFCVVFPVGAQEEDPIEVQLGERLFLEDRFSQSYYKQSAGDTNKILANGDPIYQMLETPFGLFDHPQAGRQVSCSSCHLVDQAMAVTGNLVFTYNDFSRTTPVPMRHDGQTRTVRNSMNMVGSILKEGRPLHWDGEFFSGKQLACASLAGRNMGWLNSEAKEAKRHIVKVLRSDDGAYPSESELEGSYRNVFKQVGKDMDSLSDEQLFQSACVAIADYMSDLDFSRDEEGEYNKSAYDQFLKLNNIRREQASGESQVSYLQYIRQQLRIKKSWKWVTSESLAYHEHDAQFGPAELEGMKLFFGDTQCASCHRPPDFNDFSFHNTGVSQIEYDGVHGFGAFAHLKIPSLKERKENPERHLVATATHPDWQEPFRRRANLKARGDTDLGVWNMIDHPDKSDTQGQLKAAICRSQPRSVCLGETEKLLTATVGAFKTTTLRGLGQSAPYLHNGSAQDLNVVLVQYFQAAMLAQSGRLVNPDPFIKSMTIRPHQFGSLKAFMETLDEDYD